VKSQEWATETHLVFLSESTRGIIFLGTPHTIRVLSWRWGAKGLARAVGSLKQINPGIFNRLQKDSEELDRIQETFDNLLTKRGIDRLPPIDVKCRFEEKPMTGIGQVSLQCIVLEESKLKRI